MTGHSDVSVRNLGLKVIALGKWKEKMMVKGARTMVLYLQEEKGNAGECNEHCIICRGERLLLKISSGLWILLVYCHLILNCYINQAVIKEHQAFVIIETLHCIFEIVYLQSVLRYQKNHTLYLCKQ